MKKQRGISLILCFLSAVSVLSGCGKQQVSEEVKNPYSAVVSMESTPLLDYVVPKHIPNIMVDCQGYAVGDDKTATVKGSILPDEFSLVREDSGEIVYSGRIEKIQYHREQNCYSGLADFSAFEEEGTYYLVCDRIGQSLRFQIQNRFYENLFRQAYEERMEKCQKGSLSINEVLLLLQAYEWHSSAFPDENYDDTPDILQELTEWILKMEAKEKSESTEDGAKEQEEILYAAFLAKFSYLYQSYDYSFATDCLKRASTIYSHVKNQMTKDAYGFWALTELYRATGLYTYRKKLSEYSSFFENNGSYLEEPEYLFATMTYLSTRQKIDTDLCAIFMGNIMERAEQVANRSQEMIDPMTAKNNGTEDLLKRAVEVSCANYVMNNYQYTQVTEDFLHYLMGCNPESVDFYRETENKTDYILLLAQLAANHCK